MASPRPTCTTHPYSATRSQPRSLRCSVGTPTHVCALSASATTLPSWRSAPCDDSGRPSTGSTEHLHASDSRCCGLCMALVGINGSLAEYADSRSKPVGEAQPPDSFPIWDPSPRPDNRDKHSLSPSGYASGSGSSTSNESLWVWRSRSQMRWIAAQPACMTACLLIRQYVVCIDHSDYHDLLGEPNMRRCLDI